MPNSEGISSTVGIILLVAITVALVVFASSVVFNISLGTSSDTSTQTSVRISESTGTEVTVSVVVLPPEQSLLIQTPTGERGISSIGTYTVDTQGSQITVLTNNSRRVVSTYTSSSDDKTLTVNEDGPLVANSDGYNTLKSAVNAANAGDVIVIESGVHKEKETINYTVDKDVLLTFRKNVILSCKESSVNLRLDNSQISEMSSIPETKRCTSTGEVPSYPVPISTAGVSYSAEDTDYGSNVNDSGQNLVVTVTTNESYTVVGEFGSKTLNGSGEYVVQTEGSPVSVFTDESKSELDGIDTTDSTSSTNTSNTSSGSSSSSGTIISRVSVSSDGSSTDKTIFDYSAETSTTDSTTNSTTDSTSTTNIDYNNYFVTEDKNKTDLFGENVFDTVGGAVNAAEKDEEVIITSGTHTDEQTVNIRVNKSVRVTFRSDVILSCSESNVDFDVGSGTTTDESSFPDIVCQSSGNTATVSGYGYKSCLEILEVNSSAKSGYYMIYPDGTSSSETKVKCDMNTDGGGWTRVLATNFNNGSTSGWVTEDNNGVVRGNVFTPACDGIQTNSVSRNINDLGLNYTEVRYNIDTVPLNSWDDESLKLRVHTNSGWKQVGPTLYAQHHGTNQAQSYPDAACPSAPASADDDIDFRYKSTTTVSSIDRVQVLGGIDSPNDDESIGVESGYIWVR